MVDVKFLKIVNNYGMSVEKTITSYFKSSGKDSMYTPQNEKLSASIIKSWTPQAINCYKLNCDCTKCEISQLGFSFVCQMKNVVEELLKKGSPKEDVC